MARTRSILHIRDSSTLVFTYRKGNPATGLYFDNVAITACTVEVRNADTAAVILAATPLTYVANQDGYVLAWAYAALLDGVRAITVRFVPTRAATTPAALAPSTTEDYDLSDIMERLDEFRANEQAEHDATQASLAALQADFDAFEVTNQGEHDATQALLEHATFGLAALKAILDAINTKIGANTDAAGSTTLFARLRQAVETYLADPTSGLAALNTDLDALLARLGITTDTGGSATAGTAMAKLNRILSNVVTGNIEIVPDG